MNQPAPDQKSTVAPEVNDSVNEKAPSNPPQHSASAGDITNQFPWRLHQMLDTVEKEGNASIISWLPGHPQDTFKVHDKDIFTEQVMPRFFNQTKFKSFLRQLNLWGFERILKSGDRYGGYRHSLFIKNRPDLCIHMKRVKIKSGYSQQQLAKMVQHDAALYPSDHQKHDDAGGQWQHDRARSRTNDTHDETSFDTIEYEKIPDNIPVAADLSRMYAEEMKEKFLSPATSAEDRHRRHSQFTTRKDYQI
ncbi:unnamed protein product [Cylindrotheca closterium]|uniref:HSF-type DNA-binding domain-containing protein n=2 Tax=Cylindrotheca closterium TaxID=2856 RepID=A0AAD2FZB7_9STRA|nr:unnamed protein product [Cylindrotheca closterium]CAJ1957737.1 unnamed protein product [Cylindrotheca closterium]